MLDPVPDPVPDPVLDPAVRGAAIITELQKLGPIWDRYNWHNCSYNDHNYNGPNCNYNGRTAVTSVTKKL